MHKLTFRVYISVKHKDPHAFVCSCACLCTYFCACLLLSNTDRLQKLIQAGKLENVSSLTHDNRICVEKAVTEQVDEILKSCELRFHCV